MKDKLKTKKIIKKCCMCNKLKINNKWVHQNINTQYEVSHTYCENCFKKAIARIKERL